MNTQPSSRPKRQAGEKPVLLSVRDAARLLGVGESTLWRSASRGEILKVRVGRRVLIPRTEIDRIAAGG
jgi:excisionase family DNA binding protein